jgi:hypothetical protein
MMRPTPDLPFRKPSFDHPSPPLDPSPATFYLSRSPHVSDLESSISLDGADDPKESMYGVQSLEETLGHAELTSHELSSKQPDDVESHLARRRSTLRADPGTQESSGQASPVHAASRPLTPLTLGIPDDPSSLPSSPKSISNQSLRPLDDISITDEINSQAIGSGDEEERVRGSPRIAPGGATQFIMPSITMPSRRPFTQRGKAMGRLKVLLAGASGRSWSIKFLVQAADCAQ